MQRHKARQSLEVAPTTEKSATHIANHPFPEATVIPLILGSYDGLSDPDDFLQRFEGTSRTHNWGDAVACHMLPIVLQGVARECLRARRRTHVECHDIKQKPKESLSEVIDTYTKEVAKIPDLPESQKVLGFIHCLDTEKHMSLWQRLRRKFPQTFAKAIKEAHDYMRAQEDIMFNNSRGGGSYKSKGAHDDNYAIIKDLSKTPKEILATEPVCKTFEALAPLPDYRKKDKTKFCDFHDDFGHEINKCRQLIEKVVAELKRGRLQHLKKSAKTEGNKSRQEKGYPWKKRSKSKAKEAEKNHKHGNK
ncbi:uncharacterized protein [Rutidosis leptorrhynchoides]|uniref:uncharacterized protein n=1 Tax=Rutidosis leptorrhynchoides TaxID=125765 RepID=UPI003A99D6B4